MSIQPKIIPTNTYEKIGECVVDGYKSYFRIGRCGRCHGIWIWIKLKSDLVFKYDCECFETIDVANVKWMIDPKLQTTATVIANKKGILTIHKLTEIKFYQRAFTKDN